MSDDDQKLTLLPSIRKEQEETAVAEEKKEEPDVILTALRGAYKRSLWKEGLVSTYRSVLWFVMSFGVLYGFGVDVANAVRLSAGVFTMIAAAGGFTLVCFMVASLLLALVGKIIVAAVSDD